MTEQATIEDLARAADDAGARLADGVNDLAERLTPRRIMDDALAAAKARGSELARDATGMVKAHPVVVGAAVAAVGLALYAGNRISHAELDIDNDLAGYTDYDDLMAEPAAAAGSTVADVASDARDLVSDNPVLAILAGLAAGAAMAMLFPSSESEKRSLGNLARRVTSL
ncbi:hypothetical protein [Sandarakinorhabdus sp.]|uniref:hypothetical protein n=1 Tax=Sandarakinorhabdus sp. TaxID=1916663 RepID=UPI003F6E8DB7